MEGQPIGRLQQVVRDLPPNIFAMVMATGIVSLAAHGAGYESIAYSLFVLNILIYVVLLGLVAFRTAAFRSLLLLDFTSHAKAPGFFTMVAAPCVLGNQFVILGKLPVVGLVLLLIGVIFWLGFTYFMLPGLITAEQKPPPEKGLSGAWLLLVVGTEAVSVLTCLLVPFLPSSEEWLLLIALIFWLVGSMIYLWLIAIIFHRIVFLPLSPGDLTPPYWINMGAMAIATLAGARLVQEAGRFTLLTELLPFLKGMTLLFWATATWWIPVLLVLGFWRHVSQRVSLRYDHGYWAAVFPLGMYTVCTQNLIRIFGLPFLELIPACFVWIAIAAWCLAYFGFTKQFFR
ncbi:MAG: tellurite resistance/C4-dicarboxylate transporter family protein [Gemmatales bacterium]